MKSTLLIGIILVSFYLLLFSCKKDDELNSAIAISVPVDTLQVRLSSTENAVDLEFSFEYNSQRYAAFVERPFLNANSNAFLDVANPVVLPPATFLTVDASQVPNRLIPNSFTLPNNFDLTLNAFPDISGESVKLFKRINFILALDSKVIFKGQLTDFAATYKDSTQLLSAKTSAAMKLFNDSSPDVGGIQRTPSIAYIK